MTWVELGTVNLNYQWQLLNSPSVGSETFRITHLFTNNEYVYSKALISQVYGNPYEFYGTRSLYPSNNLKLLTLPIPNDFKEQGVIVRYLALKLYWRYYISTTWQIKVEEFQ